MMIIRVLPIHVPPCYEGGYLKPLHWKHIWLMMIIWSDPSMFHDAVSPWSLHIYHYEGMQGQGPHFPPTRKATIHIHRGEGGKGVKMGTLHWGGVGGGLPNLDHISMLGPQGLSNGEFRWVKVGSVGNDIEDVFNKKEGPTNLQKNYDVGFPCLLNVGYFWYSKKWQPWNLEDSERNEEFALCTVWTQQLKNLFIHFSTSIPKRLHGYPIKDADHATKKTSGCFHRNDSGHRVSGRFWYSYC